MKRMITFIGAILVFLGVALVTQPAQNANNKLTQHKVIKVRILQVVSFTRELSVV